MPPTSRLLAAAAILLAGCTPHAQPPAPVADDTPSRIQRVVNGLAGPNVARGEAARFTIEERMRRYNVPGVSVAVIDRGRVAWARAWGVTEAGGQVPVDTNTRFQAASISKPVAAAVALRLAERGVLRLDADVNTQLRSWKVPASAFTSASPVTLRALLSHTAGMTVHGFPGYAATATVPTVQQVLEGAKPANTRSVMVDTLPGAMYRYSGGGYTVAQLLMTDVTGRAFPALARTTVLQPAGMMRSTYEQRLPEAAGREAAAGHRADGSMIPGRWHTYPEMAAAGLWTTPSDLARFAIAIQRSYDGARDALLSRESARAMVTPVRGDYGLGLSVEGAGDSVWFSHGGSNAGFKARMIGSLTGGRGVVVMTNGDQGAQLAAEISRAVATEYDWDISRPVVRDVVTLDSATLASFVGTYVAEPRPNGQRPTVTLTLEGGVLRAAIRPTMLPVMELRAASPTAFFTLESPAELAFTRDSTGRVTQLVVTGLGNPVRLTREGP